MIDTHLTVTARHSYGADDAILPDSIRQLVIAAVREGTGVTPAVNIVAAPVGHGTCYIRKIEKQNAGIVVTADNGTSIVQFTWTGETNPVIGDCVRFEVRG